jgi:hypothetical protein
VRHTAGPWKVEMEMDGPDTMTRVVAAGKFVARTRGAFGRPEHWREAEANARLIAAAPELLRVLSALTNAATGVLPDDWPILDEARDLLAEIDGVPHQGE